jgi:chaperonin GroES
MHLRPLHDRILVKRVDPEDELKGGIVIPDTAKEKPQEGVVVAVGNGKIRDNGTRVEMILKEGDRILFGKYSGNEVKIEGEEYLIMREEDVLAVTEGASKTKSTTK